MSSTDQCTCPTLPVFSAMLAIASVACTNPSTSVFMRDGATSVEFGVELQATRARSTVNALEDVTALLVSIEDGNGDALYTSHRLGLHEFGGTLASQPLTLEPDSYSLTGFMLIDAMDSVVYSTPVTGSALGHLVSDPLPIGFSVAEDMVTTVRPEVLSTAEQNPEAFGYVDFGLDEEQIIGIIDFLVSVFVFDKSSQALAMTTAAIEVRSENNDALYAGTLSALTNHIRVPDGYAEYRVAITKLGFSPYSKTFAAGELASFFTGSDRGPLVVVLPQLFASCREILDAGQATGDGIYTIDPDGAGGEPAFGVYCDMNTDSGGWTRVFYEDTRGGSFFAQDQSELNKGDPEADLYAILDDLEGFRRNGELEFLMRWPGHATYTQAQQWAQTSNPVTDSPGSMPTGYRAISIPYTHNGWSAGLQRSHTVSNSLLDGSMSPVHYWYYAVGTTHCWPGDLGNGCQPAPSGAAHVVELLVR